MNKVDVVAGILVIVGALNWGLVAIAEFDLVAALFGLDFGETNAATRVVYALVGLSGLWMAAPAMAQRWRDVDGCPGPRPHRPYCTARARERLTQGRTAVTIARRFVQDLEPTARGPCQSESCRHLSSRTSRALGRCRRAADRATTEEGNK